MVAHLIESHYQGDLIAAVQAAYAELEGHFAFVVIHHDHPLLLVGARRQCPLVVGLGDGETFLASSIAAFLSETRSVQFIDDDEIVAITPEGATLPRRRRVEREIVEIDWDDEAAEKGGYETFMLKEIYEQPDAVRETIGERIRHGGRLELDGFDLADEDIRNLRRIVVARLRHRLPRGRRRPLHASRSGRGSRSSRTSRASGSTATRCSRATRS